MARQPNIQSAIADHKVVVFSKSYCPYCKPTKELLVGELGKDGVTIYEVDEMAEGSDILAYLKEKTQQEYVPNIFINQRHIGGNDEIQAAKKDGSLAKLLALSA
ncbi:glutaredoxin [Tulasnella sp. JGI-2019a]|nr:glutaredoxin [Tulasnella sp. JGI-2019a]